MSEPIPDETLPLKPKRSHHKKKVDATALIKKNLPPANPLDHLVAMAEKNDYAQALKLILWKMRFENPDFTLEINPDDIKAFDDCVDYLEVKPTLYVTRPGAVPAQEGRPAMGNRRAVPARAAIPPKNYVVVQMLDQDGNNFKPIENNQQDFDRQKKADATRRAKDNALTLASQLAADIRSGTFSESTIGDAIIVMRTLAGQS